MKEADIDAMCKKIDPEEIWNATKPREYKSAIIKLRWIDVKDRLPDNGDFVLAVSNGLTVYAKYEVADDLVGGRAFMDPRYSYMSWENVTLWMPLPKPPFQP